METCPVCNSFESGARHGNMPRDRTGVSRGHSRREETSPAKREKPGETYPAEGPNTKKGRTSMSSHGIMNIAPCGHLCGNKPQRTVATIPDAGDANGHDQRLAQGSRASICQRAVGSHSLPGYGSVISVNRPVRTRMPGGVGAGGEKPPATRLYAYSGCYIRLLFQHF